MKLAHSVDLDHHRRLRAILKNHQNAAVKLAGGPAMRRAAKDFGLLRGKTLEIETDGELTILFDHAIYDRRHRGTTAVQRYLAGLAPTDDPDERLVREAMARHRYSMFEIEDVHPGTGLLLRDLVRGGTLFVVDESMSLTGVPGMFMAERVLPLPDYWLPTGGGFPIIPVAVRMIEQTFLPALEATEEDLENLSPEAAQELATVIIGAGFEEGSTGDVEYR